MKNIYSILILFLFTFIGQEAMQPKIIDDMIKKDTNLENIQNELIFVAKNSNIKLYNF